MSATPGGDSKLFARVSLPPFFYPRVLALASGFAVSISYANTAPLLGLWLFSAWDPQDARLASMALFFDMGLSNP